MAEIVSAFPTSIAMNDSGVQRVAEAYVYAATDLTFASPLAITDLQGVPFTGGKLTTTTGQFPQFKAPAGVTQVLVKSGTQVTLLTDVAVFAGAAIESATAAAGSAGAADSSRAATVIAQTAAETAAAQATAVGNTNDTIIEGRIKDSTSKTAVALRSTIDAVTSTTSGVPVEKFGAKGGGADDTEAIKAAIAATITFGVTLIFSQSYRVTSTIQRSFTGARWRGIGGARIYSDVVDSVISMSHTTDALFEDITFETETAGNTPNVYGVIYALHQRMRNVRWRRCRFLARNRAVNGIKLIVDNIADEFALDDVVAEDCYYQCGRMGFEVQDHTANPTVRKVRDVGDLRGTYDACGALAEGIDLSFSGPMQGCFARQTVHKGSRQVAIEFVGEHFAADIDSPTFIAVADTCYLYSFTSNSAGWAQNTRVIGGRTVGRCGFGARFWAQQDARISGNRLAIKGYVHVRDSRRAIFQGEVIDSTGNYAMFFESSDAARDCSINEVISSRLTNRESSAGFAVVRFYGAKCFRNLVRDTNIDRVAGTRIDQQNGAYMNALVRHAFREESWKPVRTIALTDADYTMSLDATDADGLIFTGSLTARRSVIFPRSNRAWRIRNATGQTLNLHAGGQGVEVTAGSSLTFVLDDAAGSSI